MVLQTVPEKLSKDVVEQVNGFSSEKLLILTPRKTEIVKFDTWEKLKLSNLKLLILTPRKIEIVKFWHWEIQKLLNLTLIKTEIVKFDTEKYRNC